MRAIDLAAAVLALSVPAAAAGEVAKSSAAAPVIAIVLDDFGLTYEKNPESYEFIDYDLTTTYFVGYKCNLSAFEEI